jgi:hypothetical protein
MYYMYSSLEMFCHVGINLIYYFGIYIFNTAQPLLWQLFFVSSSEGCWTHVHHFYFCNICCKITISGKGNKILGKIVLNLSPAIEVITISDLLIAIWQLVTSSKCSTTFFILSEIVSLPYALLISCEHKYFFVISSGRWRKGWNMCYIYGSHN